MTSSYERRGKKGEKRGTSAPEDGKIPNGGKKGAKQPKKWAAWWPNAGRIWGYGDADVGAQLSHETEHFSLK